MIVVLKVEHVPALAVKLGLPCGEGSLHLAKAEGQMSEIGEETVGLLCLELNHHIQHLCVVLGDVLKRLFGRNHGRLCKGHAVIVREYVTLELVKVFVEVRTVVEVEDTLGRRHEVVVGKSLLLGNEGDNVLTEAVNAHVKPESENLLYLLTYEGVVHVKVGLLNGEKVHVVFFAHLVPCPRLALKERVPVVGKAAVCLGRSPDIVVGVGLDSLTALLEPLVLGRGVVNNKVHDNLHASLVCAVKHLLEGVHAAEFLCYLKVV